MTEDLFIQRSKANEREIISTVKEIEPRILLVPPTLLETANRVLFTIIIPKSEFGNYHQEQYKNEKPYWVRYKNILFEKSKFKLETVIREKGNYEIPESFHLPKAMRKRGYYVEYKYLGYGDYSLKILKSEVADED